MGKRNRKNNEYRITNIEVKNIRQTSDSDDILTNFTNRNW